MSPARDRLIDVARARTLLCLHCMVVAGCAGTALYVFEQRAELVGWEFDRRLEWLFDQPLVQAAYLAAVVSCVVFPAALASVVVGKTSAWRWIAVLSADCVLAVVQGFALMAIVPVRS